MFPMTSHPGHFGVVYFCGWKNKTWLNVSYKVTARKGVRGENAVELLRKKWYKSVDKFIGNKVF